MKKILSFVLLFSSFTTFAVSEMTSIQELYEGDYILEATVSESQGIDVGAGENQISISINCKLTTNLKETPRVLKKGRHFLFLSLSETELTNTQDKTVESLSVENHNLKTLSVNKLERLCRGLKFKILRSFSEN